MHNATTCNTLNILHDRNVFPFNPVCATHCNARQHTATLCAQCNNLQRTHIHTHTHITMYIHDLFEFDPVNPVCAAHCNILQHNTRCCNNFYHAPAKHLSGLNQVHLVRATHCHNTLQHATMQCNTLKITATRYNEHTLKQHTNKPIYTHSNTSTHKQAVKAEQQRLVCVNLSVCTYIRIYVYLYIPIHI